jgi:hypothetical protein
VNLGIDKKSESNSVVKISDILSTNKSYRPNMGFGIQSRGGL